MAGTQERQQRQCRDAAVGVGPCPAAVLPEHRHLVARHRKRLASQRPSSDCAAANHLSAAATAASVSMLPPCRFGILQADREHCDGRTGSLLAAPSPMTSVIADERDGGAIATASVGVGVIGSGVGVSTSARASCTGSATAANGGHRDRLVQHDLLRPSPQLAPAVPAAAAARSRASAAPHSAGTSLLDFFAVVSLPARASLPPAAAAARRA